MKHSNLIKSQIVLKLLFPPLNVVLLNLQLTVYLAGPRFLLHVYLLFSHVSFINTFKHVMDALYVILWFLYCLGFLSIEQILFVIYLPANRGSRTSVRVQPVNNFFQTFIKHSFQRFVKIYMTLSLTETLLILNIITIEYIS